MKGIHTLMNKLAIFCNFKCQLFNVTKHSRGNVFGIWQVTNVILSHMLISLTKLEHIDFCVQ